MITLSEEQQKAVLNGEPVQVSLPEIGQDVVLLRADAFKELQEILDDERLRAGFRKAGLKSAQKWLKENPY